MVRNTRTYSFQLQRQNTTFLRLTVRQNLFERRLLGRINGKFIIMFDFDPGTSVCAFE